MNAPPVSACSGLKPPGTRRAAGPAHRGLIRTAISAGFSRLFLVSPAASAPGTHWMVNTVPPGRECDVL